MRTSPVPARAPPGDFYEESRAETGRAEAIVTAFAAAVHVDVDVHDAQEAETANSTKMSTTTHPTKMTKMTASAGIVGYGVVHAGHGADVVWTTCFHGE